MDSGFLQHLRHAIGQLAADFTAPYLKLFHIHIRLVVVVDRAVAADTHLYTRHAAVDPPDDLAGMHQCLSRYAASVEAGPPYFREFYKRGLVSGGRKLLSRDIAARAASYDCCIIHISHILLLYGNGRLPDDSLPRCGGQLKSFARSSRIITLSFSPGIESILSDMAQSSNSSPIRDS